MGSDVTRSFAAKGRSDLLLFDPEDLILITDKGHKNYDPRVELPLNERTIATMMAKGVLLPVRVRRDGFEKDSKPRVVVEDGRQRVKNLREANKRLVAAGKDPWLIKAIIEKGTDDEAFETQIVANAHRWNDDPMTKARKMRAWIERGHDESSAAITFNTTAKTVRSHLALLDGSDRLQTAVETKQVTMTLALSLVKLPRAEQDDALTKLVASGAIESPKKAAKQVAEKVNGRGRIRATGLQMRSRKEVEDMLKAVALLTGNDQARIMESMLLWMCRRPVSHAVVLALLDFAAKRAT